MRLDVWLWAVRAYKTRALAANAIKSGKVLVGGVPTKTHHRVREGEELVLRVETDVAVWSRVLCVLDVPPSRVGAKLVAQYAEDRTAPEEIEKAKLRPEESAGHRPKGSGRPTKRERRALIELNDLSQIGGLE